MNAAKPSDLRFSFTGFAARGGLTDHHDDGFGIGFFEDKACRLFMDNQAAASSPVADLIKRYPIKSCNVVSHIRKATQGDPLRLENSHPFTRELWGRHWLFAHNGDLLNFHPVSGGHYQPVGNTDSERAFCALLEELKQISPREPCSTRVVFEALCAMSERTSEFGVFNFLLSNGQALFAHCSTRLYFLERKWPFSKARLVDAELSHRLCPNQRPRRPPLRGCHPAADARRKLATTPTRAVAVDRRWPHYAEGAAQGKRRGAQEKRNPPDLASLTLFNRAAAPDRAWVSVPLAWPRTMAQSCSMMEQTI